MYTNMQIIHCLVKTGDGVKGAVNWLLYSGCKGKGDWKGEEEEEVVK